LLPAVLLLSAMVAPAPMNIGVEAHLSCSNLFSNCRRPRTYSGQHADGYRRYDINTDDLCGDQAQ